ncbi:MAG TPA: amino acid adenylation domain-containing protein, partial [Pyrinomonadaceae bacterium]|nr:amino acid adenylation domain-containing protein [Pyrinomonadaceae bacterium]
TKSNAHLPTRQQIVMTMNEGIRLAPQQRRLWALSRGDGVQSYAARSAVRLDGSLDRAALREAVGRVAGRHEILRTVFPVFPGMDIPVQVIADDAAHAHEEIDLTGLGGREQELELERLFKGGHGRPFTPQGPTLRTTLVGRSETLHVLLIDLPAACADSITLGNLAREISREYEVCRLGGAASDSPVQYADVSEVFNELLESDETEAGRAYWRRQDLSSLPNLRLPFEGQGSGEPVFAPALVSARVEPEVVEKLDAFGREFDASPSVILLACWQLLLWRLTGQADVVVGVTFDGRTYEGLSEALGLFARCLPVVCHVEADDTFADFVARVGRATNDVYEWQDYFTPTPQRGANGDGGGESQEFPYCFEFEQTAPAHTAGGVTFSNDRQYVCLNRFRVKLRCVRAGADVTAELHYDRSLYSAEEVEALSDQFDALLRSALGGPRGRVADLGILSDGQRRRILTGFNQTGSEYPRGLCVQQLFEEQAARTPERVAVSFEGRRLTYGELNARANHLARQLQDAGVGPEIRVGLYLERGVEAIVGLLGILKAGGAYVPLDPASPAERLAFMISEARLSVLLTQPELRASLPDAADAPVRVICLGPDGEPHATSSDANPPCRATPENLAYIIYTSGSTGRPKGVMVEHRSVVNLSFALAEAVYEGAGGPLAVGLNAPLTFDASVKQLLQLLHGHTLHVLPEEVRADPERFVAFLRRENLSAFDCTPFQLKSLLANGLAEEAGGRLRMVLIGGEALDERTWRVLAEDGRVEYFNLYGPTECTVDATFCRVQSSPEQATIGRPVPNAEIYILDEQLRPVAVGAPGEIHVGGAGLARGYLGRPAHTAERFIPNPFGGAGGGRLYKTGDLARYLPDGRIKYLGRNDHQLKVRGYRIELKEIEAVASEHPSVKEAVAAGREGAAGAELFLYVVPSEGALAADGGGDGGPDLKAELREFLRLRLPEYMVPSGFVVLPALPVSANGKVDRARLPDPLKDASAVRLKYEPPRNELESVIASVWREELRLERVGIHDNIFDLGGTSLVVARVFDRLQTMCGKKLRMVEMFRHPTVNALAGYLSREHPDDFRLEGIDKLVDRRKAATKRQGQLQGKARRARSNEHRN